MLLAAALVMTGSSGGSVARTAGAPRPLHVSGNRLLDSSGRVVVLRGVNRSGTEYACIQGWGIFDGPNGAKAVKAIADWHVNIVRVPLNEDCWLGINGVKRAYRGLAYRRAIVNYVKLLHRYGMYAELSLIWAAPNRYKATYQSGAPDASHSPAFWTSLARTFKNDRSVILAPWGETVVDATCFLRGGTCEATYGPKNKPYKTAGMQEAVTRMRRAGYKGVISIPGIDYANDLTHWLSHKPNDPRRQLIAEAHVYGKNSCSSNSCLDRAMRPVARKVPLIFGETGPSYDDSECGSTTISRLMTWAESAGVGYLAWTWDTWDTCNSLISDYSGSPRGEYGSWVRSHYAGLAGAHG